MWINRFKIALVQKDTDLLKNLLDEDISHFKSQKEMHEAMYLFREALELLYTLKDETSSSMKQIKKNIDFLKSTQPQAINKLDIKS